MPRKSKGARLYLRAQRRGTVTAQATWIIRDGKRDIGTGCAEHEIAEAENRLKRYLADKYQPRRKEQDIETIPIADVLSIFVDDRREHQANKKAFDERMSRINAWWGDKMLSEVTGENCRAYQKHRGNAGGTRRDLEDLRAAINHHAREGLHRGVVRVALPPKGEPRDRWLDRSEAAALIWACWRAREQQTIHRGRRKGEIVATKKRPLRHIARFILIGVYSGSRAAVIAAASPLPAIGRSYVDLARGVLHRRPRGKRATNKRAPSMPIPPRLLTHLRRWHRLGLAQTHFVEFNGKAVASVKTGFKHAVELARVRRGDELARLSTEFGNVTPHTLRHTAATWLMQNGVDPWEAAGYLGMSVETLLKTYGHHHPDHMKGAVAGITRKPKGEQSKSVSVVQSVVPLRPREKPGE